jgi:hypothetical protein
VISLVKIDEKCKDIVVRTLWCGKKVTVCKPNAPIGCVDAQIQGLCKKKKKDKVK